MKTTKCLFKLLTKPTTSRQKQTTEGLQYIKIDRFGNSIFCFSGKEKIYEGSPCTNTYMRTLMQFLTPPEDKRLSFRSGLMHKNLDEPSDTTDKQKMQLRKKSNRFIPKPNIPSSDQKKIYEGSPCTNTYIRTLMQFLTPPKSKKLILLRNQN